MTDPRECGWMGCGHPKCTDRCAGIPLEPCDFLECNTLVVKRFPWTMCNDCYDEAD